MDVILIHAPSWQIVCPPLSLGLLSSVLREHGYSVRCIDMNIDMYRRRNTVFEHAWDGNRGINDIWEKPMFITELLYSQRAYVQKTIERILDAKPRLVGFSTFATNIIASRLIAKELKKRDQNLKIVFGGIQVARFNDSKSLLTEDGNIDAVVLGEGENTIIELADMYCHNKPVSAVAGTYIKVDGEIIEGAKREPIKNLDSIPFPDFSDMDLSTYIHRGSLPTYLTRACLNKCIYCNERDFMGPFRFRSGQRVFDEIIYLMNKYPGTNFFRPADSLTNGNIKELEKLCDRLIENGINIKWCMDDAAIRREMRTPLYRKLKKSGCELIGFGLETASDSLREATGKMLARGVDAEKIIREGSKAGIGVVANFMFGLPGETPQDFEMQKRFIRRNRKYLFRVNPSPWFCYFPKGSLGYENPEKYGIDVSLGSLFWQSRDGKNNYLVRMERFFEFCDLVDKLRLSTIYRDQPPIHNVHELKGDYFFCCGDFMKAKQEYTLSLNTELRNPDVTSKLAKCYDKLGLDASGLKATYKESLDSNRLDLQNLKEISDEIKELEEAIAFIKVTASKSEIPKWISVMAKLKYYLYLRLRKNMLVRIIQPIYGVLACKMVSSLERTDELIREIKLNPNQEKLKLISEEIKKMREYSNLMRVTPVNKSVIPEEMGLLTRLKYFIYLHPTNSVFVHIIAPVYIRLAYRVVSCLETIDEQIKALKINHDQQFLNQIGDEIKRIVGS